MCERLSVMHYHIPVTRLWLAEFVFKIPWVTPLKYIRNVGLSWSGKPPHPPRKCRFGQIVALWVWVRLGPPPPLLPTYVGAGVWRLIALSPKDTVSFFITLIQYSDLIIRAYRSDISEAQVYCRGTGLFQMHRSISEAHVYFWGTGLLLRHRSTSEAQVYFWGTGLFLRHRSTSEAQIYFWIVDLFLRF